jgi:hypothetical protein
MILKIQQQTPEWLAQRVGRITGSRAKDVMARTQKGARTAEGKRYLMEIVCERLTGLASDHFVTDAMLWGSEQEMYARAAYEMRTGRDPIKCGMAIHPQMEFFSSSPDGLVEDDGVGLWEAKCPTTIKYVEWVLAGVVPDEHKDQLYSEMACWELPWVDFCAFDPRLIPRYELFLPPRFHRDEQRIAEIEAGVREFDAEANDIIGRLAAAFPEVPQSGVSPLKDQLHRSVQEIDPSLGISDMDLPAWAKAMGHKL